MRQAHPGIGRPNRAPLCQQVRYASAGFDQHVKCKDNSEGQNPQRLATGSSLSQDMRREKLVHTPVLRRGLRLGPTAPRILPRISPRILPRQSTGAARHTCTQTGARLQGAAKQHAARPRADCKAKPQSRPCFGGALDLDPVGMPQWQSTMPRQSTNSRCDPPGLHTDMCAPGRGSRTARR